LADDLNQQLQQVSLLADRGVEVDDLETSERNLIITGRRD
jgi:hypothetical protein